MAEIGLKSSVYNITSGKAPTKDTLPKGKLAFGIVDGSPAIYGNSDGAEVFKLNYSAPIRYFESEQACANWIINHNPTGDWYAAIKDRPIDGVMWVLTEDSTSLSGALEIDFPLKGASSWSALQFGKGWDGTVKRIAAKMLGGVGNQSPTSDGYMFVARGGPQDASSSFDLIVEASSHSYQEWYGGSVEFTTTQAKGFTVTLYPALASSISVAATPYYLKAGSYIFIETADTGETV